MEGSHLFKVNECPPQELTGKLPHAFPLERGEKPPVVRRRVGFGSCTTAEVSQKLNNNVYAAFSPTPTLVVLRHTSVSDCRMTLLKKSR